jgi:hypothetical protein
MGHLLFLLGSVSQKLMHKYEKESKKIGKQSFMYAWVLGRLKPTSTSICHDSLIRVQGGCSKGQIGWCCKQYRYFESGSGLAPDPDPGGQELPPKIEKKLRNVMF